MIHVVRNLLKNRKQFFSLLMRKRLLSVRNILLIISLIWLTYYLLFFNALMTNLNTQNRHLAQSRGEFISQKIAIDDKEEDLLEIFDQVLGNSCTPVIVVDSKGKPVYWKNVKSSPFGPELSYRKNHKTPVGQIEQLSNTAVKLRKRNIPILIDTGTRQYGSLELIYGNSSFVQMLVWLPFIEMGLIALLLSLIYISYKSKRITERSNLWVGLAKETAHQLGTPISSLMGWAEYLRAVCETDACNPSSLQEIKKISADMEYDLKRLSKVAGRFSQIGSVPDRTMCDIREILKDTVDYFHIRLPLHRRKIDVVSDFDDVPLIPLNRELIGWVFENLFKNSIDAIQKAEGFIELNVKYIAREQMVRFTQKDNGKGIARERLKKVFSPGFTTKKRGWGLGLTLAKRIVEDYHGGSIYISWSHLDKGTEFTIDLPVRPLGVYGNIK